MNLYGFAGGDPINFSDSFELAPCPPCEPVALTFPAFIGGPKSAVGGGSLGSVVDDAFNNGTRVIDQLEGNVGNIKILTSRPDGAAGLVRITLDPTGKRVISAGLNVADDLAKGLEIGRFIKP